MDESIICNAIDDSKAILNHVSDELWKNPELLFEEHKSHKLLTDTFEKCGFKVQRHYHLETAFKAEYSNGEGPVVCFICEYDALPEIGQACGHNLIAECGLGAAIGAKAALEKGLVKGTVLVLGTPAEEGGGGKCIMIKKGALEGVDFSIMAHPAPHDQCYPLILGIERANVKYFGKASHAAACPWGGINALDAAVACYTNISMLRQQMKPEWRIHGVITNGGTVPNIIPAETSMRFYVRTSLVSDMVILKQKFEACVKAAAATTGCTYELNYDETLYKSLVTNEEITKLYRSYAQKLGNVVFTDNQKSIPRFIASTDMGDVSHAVPSIHPMFYMGTRAANHTIEFSEAAGKSAAQPFTVVVAKAMALTAIEIMSKPNLLTQIKEEFKNVEK